MARAALPLFLFVYIIFIGKIFYGLGNTLFPEYI
jgi:hypothetical protein